MATQKKSAPQNTAPSADTVRILTALKSYRAYKQEIDRSFLINEDWFRSRHWKYIKGNTKSIGHEPTTPFILNAVWNKHADAMDNYPEPLFLEREKNDREEARKLSKIVPLVLEKNDFEKVYSDVWWQKIKQGTGIYYVGWDPKKDGIGDIVIRKVDLLSFYAQPYIDDIQKSQYVFVLSIVDTETLRKQYPGKKIISDANLDLLLAYPGSCPPGESEGKSCLIDCYEKCRIGGKDVIHLSKLVGETLLYSTKSDKKLKDTGLYEHGLYPFVIDPFIPNENSLYGMGMIEIARPTQEYIDRLDYLIEANCLVSGRPRWLVKRSGGIRPQDIADLSRDIIECDSSVDDNAVRPIQAAAIPSHIIEHRQNKIEELKEVIGNRDFSQGGTTGNITAYKSISALQEAGSKLSRDTLKSSYRSFKDVVNLCVELIREFYDEERSFRIIGPDNTVEYTTLSNAHLKPVASRTSAGETVYRKAIFDIKISSQRKNAFNTESHNALITSLFEAGAFTPENAESAIVAIDAMMLENKDSIIKALQNMEKQQG